MNLRVVRALIMKYAFISSRNTFRAMDVLFWPVMDLLIWGFLTVYMMKISSAVPTLMTCLIGSIILWNVLHRAQQVVSVSFLDDVWSRNMLNVFAAPIRTVEYVGAAYMVGFVQASLVVILLGVMASLLYSFNLMSLGLSFGFLFANLLLMGWSLGLLTTGFVFRWGPPAEALAWAIPGLIQPLSAVFYPVNILPTWLQPIAMFIPSTHVFEGMRQILTQGKIDDYHMWCASLLNVIYMVISSAVFHCFFQQARERGNLAKYGT